MADAPDAGRCRLVLRGVHKDYGQVRALRGVDLQLLPGEIHALVGENGAGKSTCLRIAAGLEAPDSGTLAVGREPVRFASVAAAHEAGVVLVPQEPVPIPALSVSENLTVGCIPSRWGLVDHGRRRALAREAAERVGLTAVLARPAGALTPAELQALEIAKALVRANVNVLLLDEPTSRLTPGQRRELFSLLRGLRDQRLAILLVTHHLADVAELADRVTVLRDGEVVLQGSGSDIPDTARLAQAISGGGLAELAPAAPRPKATQRPASFRADSLTCEPFFRDVTFEARPGDVVGIAGLEHSGVVQLFECITGQRPIDGGAVHTEAGPAGTGAGRAFRAGIVSLTGDRSTYALPSTVLDNFLLGSRSRWGVRRRKDERRDSLQAMQRMQVKYDGLNGQMSGLSGGNQQKVLFARTMSLARPVIALFEPTAGVDVGARQELFRLVREAADAEATVLWFSSDPGELSAVTNRLYLLVRGRLQPEIQADAVRGHSDLVEMMIYERQF